MKRFLLLLVAGTALCAAQNPASIDHVDASTPPEVQIQLALSAAPPAVSQHATVYVLSRTGYVKAREGNNGFTCLVEREYPTSMEPECFDRETSNTTLRARMYLEAERAKGRSDEQIQKEIEAGYKSGRFKASRKPGIIYMLSDSNYVFDPSQKKIIHFPGHLMFPAPYITAKDLGSEAGNGVPYIVAPGTAQALIIVVPAGHGSSNTSSQEHKHD
jgi:hypothetical protein